MLVGRCGFGVVDGLIVLGSVVGLRGFSGILLVMTCPKSKSSSSCIVSARIRCIGDAALRVLAGARGELRGDTNPRGDLASGDHIPSRSCCIDLSSSAIPTLVEGRAVNTPRVGLPIGDAIPLADGARFGFSGSGNGKDSPLPPRLANVLLSFDGLEVAARLTAVAAISALRLV